MRNVSSFFGLVALGATIVAGAAYAQTPAAAPAPAPTYAVLTAPTVAVVDFQRVLQDSAAGRNIISQLDAERRKFRDQVAKMDEELKNGENELKRQRAVMAPEQVSEQVQGLQRKQADYQRVIQDRQEALQRGENEALNVVSDNLRDIVQQFAAERRIGMVLRKEAVISMADKNMDITDDVIQRLNTKLPSVVVTVAPPGATQTAAQPTAPATAPAAPPAKTKK
jgi:Skp family chaperone for outer membrane proteins